MKGPSSLISFAIINFYYVYSILGLYERTTSKSRSTISPWSAIHYAAALAKKTSYDATRHRMRIEKRSLQNQNPYTGKASKE